MQGDPTVTTEDRELQRPVAIVTGAGSGIGAATALALAGTGMHVLGVGRRPSALRQTAAQHPLVDCFPADLRSAEAPTDVIAAATERWGRVDAVVNNAGGTVRAGLTDVTAAVIGELMSIHVVTPTLLTKAALPWLRIRGGCVVNVSSVFAHRPSPGSAHYGAAKAALEHLTRTWALEHAADGIRVNAVAPGPTETEALRASGLSPAEAAALKSAQRARIPLGRRGEAAEIARWIAHLVGPDASWITGQVITVDGGLELR